MRVLNLSLDTKVLEKDSAVEKRLILLAEKAGEMTVFVPGESDEERELSPSLTVHSFGGPKFLQLWKMWRKGRKLLKNPPAHKNEPPPLRKEELKTFDLITVQDVYFLGWLGVKLSKLSGIPLEIQVHGLEKLSGLRERLARYVLSHANKVRVVSHRLQRLLTTYYQLPTTKIYELSVGTQIEASQKYAKRKTVPYPFTFLTVSRLVPVKNIEMQIRALGELVKTIPHVRLRIVGEGPIEESLKLQVQSLKLQDKISFEGYQKDLTKYYEEADAFMLTSDSEGWGRVLLEAAAYALPIIMTDVGLAQEVLLNNESAFVIKPGDTRELVLAMQELVDQPELRNRIGEGAFQAFRALPSIEKLQEEQVREWRSLIRNPR